MYRSIFTEQRADYIFRPRQAEAATTGPYEDSRITKPISRYAVTDKQIWPKDGDRTTEAGLGLE
jgi:hypothetical protein